MRMVKRVANRIARRSIFVKRGILALAALPILTAFAPAQASAQQQLQTVPLQGTDTAAILFEGYLPFSSPGGSALQGFLTHTAARDLMMATLFAICLAMVIAASYLWRENVNHLKADAERRQRNDFDSF
ncbi:hypothetical protein [Martelella soudanensis]|uniref:hypothetical protein n=1 Tax=unclassified Martelella TaxID=2629616 RepID=UPI0015DDD712|nr:MULTISPECIES: hypothetical protein [unclassified Martelella]